MSQFLFGNFFETELTVGVTATTTTLNVPPSATLSLPLVSGGTEARLVLWDGTLPPEIVGCTSNPQTGSLVVTRAQEGTTAQAWQAGTQIMSAITADVMNQALAAYFDFLVVLQANYLPLTGGTLTGPLTLAADPLNALDAATKQYVDTVQGNKLPLAGGTMAGAINMNGNRILSLPLPISAQEPATKGYVDIIQTQLGKLLTDISGSLLTTGTGSGYLVATNTVYTALTDGTRLAVRLHTPSRLGATLTVDTTVATPIQRVAGEVLPDGALLPNTPYMLVYNAGANAWLIFDTRATDTDWSPGDLKHSVQAADHGRWLLADGRQMARTGSGPGTAAALYNVVSGIIAAAGSGWGVGDGVTTFNILDGRGRVFVGRDNMGGSTIGRITSAECGIDGTVLGVAGGTQSTSLTTAQLASHQHDAFLSDGGQHAHPLAADGDVFTSAGTIRTGTRDHVFFQGGANAIGNTSNNATDSIKIRSTAGSLATADSKVGATGSGSTHTNVQPTTIVNIFVRY